jgi:hypothetical protein
VLGVTGDGMGPLGGPASRTGAGAGRIEAGICRGTVDGPGELAATGSDSVSNDSAGIVSVSDSAAGGIDGGVLAFATGSSVTSGAAGSRGGASSAESNDSGQVGIASAGGTGCFSSDDGGHAGMARSVGGSGGQMSVSCGGAGADTEDGGHVDFLASAATDFGGSVFGASPLSSSSFSPGDVGTVCAHSGVAFFTGTGPPDPFSAPVPGSASVQSGSPFCIGSAGSASSVLTSGCGGWLLSAGSTGTV